MDIQNVITLINAVSTANITNFQIEEGNFKLRIDKVNSIVESNVQLAASSGNLINGQSQSTIFGTSQDVNSTPIAEAQTFAIQQPVPVQPLAVPVQTTNAAPVNIPENNELLKEVKSPIVGTYYSASSPETEDFVKVGDKVKKGQTLCIIEAMKLMNEIESDYDGEITEILLKNEQMVEFNQPLFVIKIDG